MLPPAIKAFRKLYPKVCLQIENASSSEIANSLRLHRANVGISHAFPEVAGIIQETLVEAPHVCAVPAGPRLAEFETIEASDLASENVIRILPIGTVNWEDTKRNLDDAKIGIVPTSAFKARILAIA